MRKCETSHALLETLAEANIQLTVSGDKLSINAPKGALTDELREAIRQHKTELLNLLYIDETAPDGTYAFTNPQTGQRFITYLYRCPACEGTDWGPKLDEPDTWWCLDCHPAGAGTSKKVQ